MILHSDALEQKNGATLRSSLLLNPEKSSGSLILRSFFETDGALASALFSGGDAGGNAFLGGGV